MANDIQRFHGATPGVFVGDGVEPDVRRFRRGDGADVDGPDNVGTSPGRLGLSRGELNSLVDEVVHRIERRVVEELERRGRRQNPGAI